MSSFGLYISDLPAGFLIIQTQGTSATQFVLSLRGAPQQSGIYQPTFYVQDVLGPKVPIGQIEVNVSFPLSQKAPGIEVSIKQHTAQLSKDNTHDKKCMLSLPRQTVDDVLLQPVCLMLLLFACLS